MRSTVIRALKVAFVITPILTGVNHSQEIMALDFSPRFYLQALLTFCVPFLVSTYSSAMTRLADMKAVVPDS
jgi:hypothetical protein